MIKIILLLIIIICLCLIIGLNININEPFDNLKLESQSEIPKIIHQIDLGNNVKPQPQQTDFKYILWNSKMIDTQLNWTNDFRMIYDIEKEKKGKSYIARMLILHQYGGIFLESDSIWNDIILTRYIDKARNQQTNFFAAREPNLNYLSNSILGSTSQHPVLAFMLNKLEELTDGYQEIREKMPVDLVTGMGLLSKADVYNYHITLVPYSVFYPKNKNDCIQYDFTPKPFIL